jgi:hypothetical protein
MSFHPRWRAPGRAALADLRRALSRGTLGEGTRYPHQSRTRSVPGAPDVSCKVVWVSKPALSCRAQSTNSQALPSANPRRKRLGIIRPRRLLTVLAALDQEVVSVPNFTVSATVSPAPANRPFTNLTGASNPFSIVASLGCW